MPRDGGNGLARTSEMTVATSRSCRLFRAVFSVFGGGGGGGGDENGGQEGGAIVILDCCSLVSIRLDKL